MCFYTLRPERHQDSFVFFIDESLYNLLSIMYILAILGLSSIVLRGVSRGTIYGKSVFHCGQVSSVRFVVLTLQRILRMDSRAERQTLSTAPLD